MHTSFRNSNSECFSIEPQLKIIYPLGNTLIPRDFRFGTERPIRPISVTRDTDFVGTCQCNPGVHEATEKP